MYIISQVLGQQEDIDEGNKNKMQDAVNMWHNAKNMPRKKKKQVRKKAQEEYSFWVSIDRVYRLSPYRI